MTMTDISHITQLVDNFRAETQKDAITPESLGALLQAMVNLLQGTAEQKEVNAIAETLKGSGESLLALQNLINAIVEKTSRGTMYHAKGIIPPMIDLSQVDSVPGVTSSSQMARMSFPVEYIVTSMGYPMGTLFIFGDSMGHAVTQVIVTHSLLDESGVLSANHGNALHVYYRRYNITTHHGTAGEWTPWQDFVSPEKFATLTRNVLDLGTFESEEAALIAAKLTNVSADASVSLIRFNWDGGKKNGFILQQVGSQVDDNLIDTYQFYTYGGRCWYRLIQWYYENDDKGHKSGDFYTATTWKSPFGNTLRFNENSRTLQLLSFKNDLVSQVTLPNDSLEDYVAGVEYDQGYLVVDAMARGQAGRQAYPLNIPTLQTAWNTGSEGSFIYSKPWVNGGDNSKTVLTVGSHIAQHGGKLKMRYIFWGGGSGAAYGNEVPVATATCDGAMSATDKALLDNLKKRVEALESKI